MQNAIQERIQAKTRDSQLFEIFVNHFEFFPRQPKLPSIQSKRSTNCTAMTPTGCVRPAV